MDKFMKFTKPDTEEMLSFFIESTEECIVIVDNEGFIRRMSKAYAEFLSIDRDEAIGKHVTEVIENTRMHIVAETGESEIAQRQIIRGENVIVSRIPIVIGGEIIGAFGRIMFKNIAELNALHKRINNIEEELTMYKKTLVDSHRAIYSLNDIVTVNTEMIELKDMIRKVAKTGSTVLLLGESGTGKELFAHSIHNASRRSKKPFVSINCGAIPPELLESELFGYESGAFTGASKKGKIGIFKVADGGTLLLDEVGELPENLQVKLLRFLQEKEIKRIGSTTNEKVDVRIITATNRDLFEMIKEKKFRSDIYYRLSVVTLSIPPLRDRREDIGELAKYLLSKISRKENICGVRISDEAMACMMEYDWPGNVRELENVLESAINFVGPDNTIWPDKLPARLIKSEHAKFRGSHRHNCGLKANLKTAMDAFEKEFIIRTLHNNNYNKSKSSEALGISRANLYEKMKRYKIPLR